MTREEFEKLWKAGTPIIEELARKFGTTETAVKKLIEAGAVRFTGSQEDLNIFERFERFLKHVFFDPADLPDPLDLIEAVVTLINRWRHFERDESWPDYIHVLPGGVVALFLQGPTCYVLRLSNGEVYEDGTTNAAIKIPPERRFKCDLQNPGLGPYKVEARCPFSVGDDCGRLTPVLCDKQILGREYAKYNISIL